MNKYNKHDCFARKTTIESLEWHTECSALIVKSCEKCKFYRNDITREKIEKDINKYSSIKGIKKNEY